MSRQEFEISLASRRFSGERLMEAKGKQRRYLADALISRWADWLQQHDIYLGAEACTKLSEEVLAKVKKRLRRKDDAPNLGVD